jgi:hypothetical protein
MSSCRAEGRGFVDNKIVAFRVFYERFKHMNELG